MLASRLSLVLFVVAIGLAIGGCDRNKSGGETSSEEIEQTDSSEEESGVETDGTGGSGNDESNGGANEDEQSSDGSSANDARGDGSSDGSSTEHPDGSSTGDTADADCFEECVAENQMRAEPIEEIRAECREECGITDTN